MTHMKDLPTSFLWHALKTNPNAQTFPWTVNGFAAGEVPRTAIYDELRSRPDGKALIHGLPMPSDAPQPPPVKIDLNALRSLKTLKPRVVFVGNFSLPHSTESHHKWTWEQMGWAVTALQENQTTADAVVAACQTAQLLQYTHTHGWNTGGSYDMDEALRRVRLLSVPSFSYHLDMYWGLGKLDRREDRIGRHPSWKVDHYFSTDGAHDEEYKARGVNHHWMPPGIVARGCFKGTFRPGQQADVAFVGSTGYHPEYPFRGKLIQALKERYGTRFRTYTGVREQLLNDVYASVKVVVGDHCFAGMPRYWSDRLPETCGRGGFLIYPETEGMTIPTATYKPQDLEDLFQKIDYYLAHEDERLAIRNAAFEHVKRHDTYTQRLQEVLRVVFGDTQIP